MKKKKVTVYNVWYYTLEPSYYEHSERNYESEDFDSRKEALDYVKTVKKLFPAQIIVKKITTETILDLRDTDNYK